MENALKPGGKKKGQGAMPLAESRGGASGGVWGNAPTAGRVTGRGKATNSNPRTLNSEALSAQQL